ncbi:alpha/beta fold hydrolase [Natronosalvus vescus]|uniref:alpha/beta fold hydrolase n=1 Tax=Natronosalvus vescus TaxID=2953881 RepID=UPI0020916D3C|nr:alpha/beta hydrolase [Natronosalvus vescus]
MPTVTNRGASLYYSVDGEGPPIVFIADAGLGGWLWGWQHAALAGPFETVIWDLRGTGRSDAPGGPYALETLVSDFEAVCRAVGARRVNVVGLGLGGAIALAAAHRTSRVETLTLIGTAAHESAYDLEPMGAPLEDVESSDQYDRDDVRRSTAAMLSPDFRNRHPDVVDGIVDWRLEGDATPAGFHAQRGALSGFDARDWLVDVTQPTQVLHGMADERVPDSAGRDLARGLPRGSFVPLEGAGHLANVEHSRTVSDRLFGFLESQRESL